MDKFYKESKMSFFGGATYSSTSSSSSSKENPFYDEDGTDSEDGDFESPYVAEEDAIEWVVKNEAYCFDFTRFSEKLVNATLTEATKQMACRKIGATATDVVEPLVCDLVASVASVRRSDSRVSELSYAPPNLRSSRSNNRYSDQSIEWPKISEFNIKLGLEKLEDYVSTWKRSKDWLFCVEFLGFESEDCSNIFVYEVEWSRPTNAYPIPQATASVYFALEVLKMVPYNHDRCVEVTYIFESSNMIHSPGKINFQEKWLEAIIFSKLKVFKSLLFSVPKGICQAPPKAIDPEPIRWKL